MRQDPIAGFQSLRAVGGGPLTQVHEVLDPANGTKYALKIIRDGSRKDPTALDLLRTEAKVGMAIDHPNVVRFESAHVLEEPHYILMEWLEGETLRARLRREKCLPWRETARILAGAATGLAALHRKRYLHGDVKPENLFLCADGEIKLIDLGFAHKAQENQRMLDEGFVLGTANYVAPELCEDESVDEPPCDLFSLGVTCFEMLTGRLPYPSGDVEETMRRHRDDEPDSLNSYAGDWPDKMADLVSKLLDKRYDRRPKADSVVRIAGGMHTTLRRRAA